MTAIFISHSSLDREASGDVKAALTRLGFEHTFLDFDKETGLDIGENWEKRLYEELVRCHAVVLVLTPAWQASKWCFVELTQARALGKVILPLLCRKIEGRVLPDIQAVDLLDWNADGLQRLERRLLAISDELARGFTRDPTRPPYPGINAFQKEDAAIYFGRDEESRTVLERLDARRTQGGARFVAIIGASGSGKSSLLKASVLPLLARRRAQWVILPDIRPEKAPIEALAKVLAQHARTPETWRDWHAALNGPEGMTAIERLVQDARIGEARTATVLLPIDQFEECFTTTPSAERAGFLGLLQGAFESDIPFMVIATGRSDVLEGLIESSELVGHYETFPLPAMPPERYPRLIEGPAAVAGIMVEKGLPERIVRDVESKEALPLLAHMLALLYQRGGEDRKLNLGDYEALGDPARGLSPIQNSIRLAADEAIARVKPNKRELVALRDAFIPHLVRVRPDDGKRVRQTALRSDLPQDALRLIGTLVEARLLTTRTEGAGQLAEPLVEVTHEALFRAWPTLDQWLTEEQVFLTDLERIRSAQENWSKAPDEHKSGELLYGHLLLRARDWLLRYPQRFISREMEPLRAFIEASAAAADVEKEREAAREAREKQMRTRQLYGAVVAAIVAGALAVWGALSSYVAAQQRDQALITQSRFLTDKAREVFEKGDHGTALALSLEALPDEKRGIKRPHVASAESMLYRALMALREQKTLRIEMEDQRISSAEISPDGRRVLVGASQLEARLLDAETGAEIKRVADTTIEFDSGTFTSDGRHLVVKVRNGGLRILDAADGRLIREFPPPPPGPEPPSFSILPDGRRVIATRADGRAQLWDVVEGKVLRALPEGVQTGGNALSPDGRWLATYTDKDKQVRVLKLDGDAEPLVIGETIETIHSPMAFFFPDSRRALVKSGDGHVQVWDIEQRKPITTLFENQLLRHVTFSPDATWMVLAWHDRIFVYETADLLQDSTQARPSWQARHVETIGGGDPIYTLAFSPDSRLLAAASRDGTVNLWRLAHSRDSTLLRLHDGPVYAAMFSADGQRLITVGSDKTIRHWNGTPGGMVLELGDKIEYPPTHAMFSPDSRKIVGRSGLAPTVWDLATGGRVANLGADVPISHAFFLDDSRVVLRSQKLVLWDTVSGATSIAADDQARFGFYAVSRDRKHVAMYGPLHLWTPEAGASPTPVDAKFGVQSSATFSPDGQRLAVTTTLGFHLIDPTNRKQVAGFEQNSPTLEGAAYSRDGRTLFVGDRQGLVRVLDSATLASQSTWSLGDSAIIDLKLSPDDSRLLVVTHNGTRIFDIATREEVAVLDRAIEQATYSPDGRFIATVSQYHPLLVWPTFPNTQALVDYARSIMPRPLTVQQRRDFFLSPRVDDAATPRPPR